MCKQCLTHPVSSFVFFVGMGFYKANKKIIALNKNC